MTITKIDSDQQPLPPAPAYPRVQMETWVQVGGYTFRIMFNDMPLAEALAALERRGCTPAAPPSSGSAGRGGWTGGKGGKARAERVNPEYSGQGDACCPVHHRVLRRGEWGLHCTARDAETGEYCKLKFNE